MYTGYRITHAHGLSIYQLPVKESLVCSPPTKIQLLQCIMDYKNIKTLDITPAQPQIQQCQPAHPGTSA